MSAKEVDIVRLRESALEAVPQGILITDSSQPDNPIIYANPAFERLTGYAAGEIIGRNCRFLAGPDTSPQTRAEIRAAIAANRPFHGVILNYRKDGSQFWNELTIAPIREEGEDRYCVGVQVDVTTRLELEDRLRESQKMEALGRLSGGIAHDFNNILALILANAELIAQEVAPGSPVAEAAGDIVEAAEGGSKLVARMLQFARGYGAVAEEVNVNQAVGDVIRLLGHAIGEGIRIRTDLDDDAGPVSVDKTLFETALLNLALNARDALPHGGVITFATRRVTNAAPGLPQAVEVTVHDNGVGMDKATQRRAFEPFFTTKKAGRGTGLGLSTVYSFATQSHGRVSIASARGDGAVVTLLLPPAERTAAAVQAGEAMPEARMLVVDDDGKVRKALALHLTRAGHAVDEAANAEEALALIEARKPQALISDIRLRAEMSGIELVAAARRRWPGLPAILITGFADELEEGQTEIGGVPVLRKPFRADDLLRARARLGQGAPKAP